MKILITVLFLSFTILGNSKMLNTGSFDAIVQQMDDAKNVENLLLMHKDYYAFLRKNYLSKKSLTPAELENMIEVFSAEKLSYIINRYNTKIKRFRKENKDKYYELRQNGISSLADYQLKLKRLVETTGKPLSTWNEPKLLHELFYKASPTAEMIKAEKEFEARRKAEKDYLESLKSRGITPAADKLLHEIGLYPDEPGFRSLSYQEYAQVYLQAIKENNEAQLEYMLQYKFVKEFYTDLRRLLKYYKIRMKKDEFIELYSKIGVLLQPFEKIVIKQSLVEAKKASDWKKEQLELRKAKIRENDKNKPKRVSSDLDGQRIAQELKRLEQVLESGDKDQIASALFFGYGIHYPNATQQMKKAILNDWKNLEAQNFLEVLIKTLKTVQNDARNHFVFENRDFVLFMPKEQWPTFKRDKKNDWLTVKGIHLRYDKSSDKYYLDKTAEYRNSMSYLVEFK